MPNPEKYFENNFEWQKYLELIHHSVRKNDVKPKKRTEDGFAAWIIDRDDVQKKIDAWLTCLKSTDNQAVKDGKKAETFKEQGNQFFKKKNYPESVKSYTESAKYAPLEGGGFATAIANRSAAFFHMCRYKESLQDIELTLECGYPEGLSYKLHLRAAQCHLKLREGKLAEAALARLKNAVDRNSQMSQAIRDTILKQHEQLYSTAVESQRRYENFVPPAEEKMQALVENMLPNNSTFPFASANLILERSPTKGRYVIAAKPIKKGDVLFVEKPFAWVPVTHGNDVILCAHCCGPVDDALFPCRGCLDSLYCSAACWKDSWSYHQWECPGYHMGLWQQIGVAHLAFKIFLISITTSDETWFNNVQRLVTNVDKRTVDDVFGIAICSLMVTNYIERFTNFFDVVDLKTCSVDKFADPGMSSNFDVSTRKGKKLYVVSMILRHSLQMLANAYAVTRLMEVDPSESEVMVESQVRIAAGAYPSASMLNHSCDPTVIHAFWKNWLIVKAVKDVAEGEGIFNCYGPYFKRMPRAQRQTDLKSQYCFDCECTACVDPLFANYTDRFHGLKCLKCSGSALHSSDRETQRCFDCGAITEVTCNEALQRASELYDTGIQLTDVDKWKEAIPCFERSLTIREKHMYKHSEDVALTLDALGKSYGSTGGWLKSIWYFEKSIAAVGERYGEDSIEVGNELNKITDVCMQYLRRTMSRRSSEYRDTFTKTRKLVDRAIEILNLTSVPLTDKYQEMDYKKEQLCGMMEQLRL